MRTLDLKELTGPFDVEIAQYTAKDSLRARFGSSKVFNGVHCTDLPSDGRLEARLFTCIAPHSLFRRVYMSSLRLS